jgi:predicted metal-dependent peptidase
MKAKEMIDKAMLVIANHHDFFAPAAMAMPWIEDSSVPTACTNGERVLYSAEFVESLSMPAVVGLVIHEIAHPLLGHLDRGKRMDPEMANVAFDYEINNLIAVYNEDASRKIILPAEALVDVKKYGNEAGEVIYKKLLEEQKNNPPPPPPPPKKNDGDDNDDGTGDGKQDNTPDNNDGDNESKSKPDDSNNKGKGTGKGKPQASSSGMFEQPSGDAEHQNDVATRWREIMSSSIQTAKLRGTMSGDFLQKFSDLSESPISLRDLLDKYVCEFAMSDDSTKADKRWLANHDMCVSGMESERHGTIVFVKDTSGSITDSILKTACSVIQDAVNTLNASRLVVLDVDAEVCDVQEFMPNEEIPLTCKGRGGTDFRPAFDWVRDNASDARVLIYLTDGWGDFPKEVPDIPTLWLSWDRAESCYPFGQVVPLSVLNNITA